MWISRLSCLSYEDKAMSSMSCELGALTFLNHVLEIESSFNHAEDPSKSNAEKKYAYYVFRYGFPKGFTVCTPFKKS